MSEIILPEAGLPAHLQGEVSGAGRLDDEQGMLSPPRLKLLQGLSSEVTDGKGSVGEYWSDAHGQTFHEMNLIPIRFETEWMEFYRDEDEKAGVKWRTTNPNDPNVLGLGEEAWRSKYINMLCLGPIGVPDVTPKLNIFAFHGHGNATARSMYAEIRRTHTNVDMQALVFHFTSEDKKGATAKQKVKAPVARFAGYADEALFAAAKEAYRVFADQNLNPSYDDNKEGAIDGEKVDDDDKMPF